MFAESNNNDADEIIGRVILFVRGCTYYGGRGLRENTRNCSCFVLWSLSGHVVFLGVGVFEHDIPDKTGKTEKDTKMKLENLFNVFGSC